MSVTNAAALSTPPCPFTYSAPGCPSHRGAALVTSFRSKTWRTSPIWLGRHLRRVCSRTKARWLRAPPPQAIRHFQLPLIRCTNHPAIFSVVLRPPEPAGDPSHFCEGAPPFHAATTVANPLFFLLFSPNSYTRNGRVAPSRSPTSQKIIILKGNFDAYLAPHMYRFFVYVMASDSATCRRRRRRRNCSISHPDPGLRADRD